MVENRGSFGEGVEDTLVTKDKVDGWPWDREKKEDDEDEEDDGRVEDNNAVNPLSATDLLNWFNTFF